MLYCCGEEKAKDHSEIVDFSAQFVFLPLLMPIMKQAVRAMGEELSHLG